ncbi:uncharacterized protein [Parasteatoda tepidariorum]|uniref:uncharacterized protein n=1 Tax=Parasteatoda tepidariorum TaxID=114398 RepID=UPI00077FC579|nr:uncharacterized protein LOC107457491 [Parasteatoda tepidariorum]XP_042898035.1 uncharacterized protein LOC107457491 [Parasteatoda tepidariorum]
MQIVTVATLLAIFSVTQAAVFSWMTVPLVLLSVNKQVEGFFSLFRRRPAPKVPMRKEVPEGPVQPAMPNFPQQNLNLFNPFGSSGFSALQNIPSFSNPFQGNRFVPQQPMRQPWFSQSQSIPSQNPVQPAKQSFAPASDFSAQNFQQNPNFGLGQSFGQSQQSFEAAESNFGSDQSFGSDRDMRFDDTPPPINAEEAESFFTLLAETDENKCISRLVCEMGADPTNAGDLGQTVTEIIGSLTDFPPGTKVFEYNEILMKGRSQGASSCVSEFPSCDEETYVVMKSNQPDEAELAEGANSMPDIA